MNAIVSEHSVDRFIQRFDQLCSRVDARALLESLVKTAERIGPAISRGEIYRSMSMPSCDMIVVEDVVSSVWYAPLGCHVVGEWQFRRSMFEEYRHLASKEELLEIVNTARVQHRRLDGGLLAYTACEDVLEIFAQPRERRILSVERREARCKPIARAFRVR